MGFGGMSIGSLLLILVIVLVLFGTKKLRNIGGDLGSAIKGFKDAMHQGESGGASESGRLEQQEKRDQPSTVSINKDRQSP